jgi:hypothetical protein
MSILAFPAAGGRSAVNESIIPLEPGGITPETDIYFPQGISAESLSTATQTHPGEGGWMKHTHH